jgi:hypothetical protein
VVPPVVGVSQKAWSPIQRSLWQSASGSVGLLLVAQRMVQFPTPVVLSTLRQPRSPTQLALDSQG